MKSGLVAVGLVIAANGAVLLTTGRERAGPVRRAVIELCGDSLPGGSAAEASVPLRLVPGWPSVPAGLDSAGLRALGFDDRDVGQVGHRLRSGFGLPRARPAWVLIRQRSNQAGSFEVVQVAPDRERLRPDSTMLLVLGLAGLRFRWDAREVPSPDSTGRGPARADQGTVYPAILEVMPAALHLDRRSVEGLRSARVAPPDCPSHRVTIANGANGGIWVESVR